MNSGNTVLDGNFSFVMKEIAATILRYVAWNDPTNLNKFMRLLICCLVVAVLGNLAQDFLYSTRWGPLLYGRESFPISETAQNPVPT